MSDFVKIALKTTLILSLVAAIVVLFGVIQFPALDLSLLINIVGFAKSVFIYYVPFANVFLNIIFVLIFVSIAAWTFYFSSLAVKWIIKVNE